jgi:hypothetical protein
VGVDTGLFRLLYRVQQRNTPFVVVIHANAKIDLACAGVGIVLFIKAKDGVARSKFDGFEERFHFAGVKVEEVVKRVLIV